MRPIKFRGFGSKKLFSEEKWYYGSLIIVCGEYGIQPPLIQLMDKVIPETVGQFTGCYDGTKWEELTPTEQSEFLASKKGDAAPKWQGKEIYEGDILEWDAENWQQRDDTCREVVAWNDRYTGFIPFDYRSRDEEYPNKKRRHFGELSIRRGKIIGNIHDNPELLIKEVQP